MEKEDIDTCNYQAVAMKGGRIIIMLPQPSMTRERALLHAAWIVAMADMSDDNDEFKAVLRAVQNT